MRNIIIILHKKFPLWNLWNIHIRTRSRNTIFFEWIFHSAPSGQRKNKSETVDIHKNHTVDRASLIPRWAAWGRINHNALLHDPFCQEEKPFFSLLLSVQLQESALGSRTEHHRSRPYSPKWAGIRVVTKIRFWLFFSRAASCDMKAIPWPRVVPGCDDIWHPLKIHHQNFTRNCLLLPIKAFFNLHLPAVGRKWRYFDFNPRPPPRVCCSS